MRWSRRLPDYLRVPEVSIDMSLSNRYVDLIDEGFVIGISDPENCRIAVSLPVRLHRTACSCAVPRRASRQPSAHQASADLRR